MSIGLYACFKHEEDDASVNEDFITDLNNGSLVSDGTEGQRFLPDVTLGGSLPTSVSQYDSIISNDAEGQRFFFPTRQNIVRRAADPERAAWPSSPMMGAMGVQLPTSSQSLTHQPQSPPRHGKVWRGMREMQ